MREIKFRIWNPSGNNMLYDLENVFECLMQQHRFDKTHQARFKEIAYDHKSEGMVWMQFTGLLDKNGKEIYEGDIIEYEVWHGGIEHLLIEETLKNKGFPPPNYKERRVVIGHPAGHYITRKLYDLDDMTYVGDTINHSNTPKKEWEVIGNIYEHKHLLQ